jgi:hypothetical protein
LVLVVLGALGRDMNFCPYNLLKRFKHFRLEERFDLLMLHACCLVQKLLGQLPIDIPDIRALQLL